MSINELLSKLARWAPALVFGVVFLYWEGYVYMTSFFLKFSIPPNWSALTFQQILISGVWPIILLCTICLVILAQALMSFFQWISSFLPGTRITATILLAAFTVILIHVAIFSDIFLRALRTILSRDLHLHFTTRTYSLLIWYVRRWAVVIFLFLILFILPVWAGYSTASYDPLRNVVRVDVEFQAPKISGYDRCKDDVCNGEYLQVFESSEYIYLVIAGECDVTSKYPRAKCTSFALPKDRVLRLFYLLN